MPKPSVRRETYPRASLFGLTHWWTVYLTPWQPIASFDSWRNALGYAQLIAPAFAEDHEVGRRQP